MAEQILNVTGMTCDHCVRAVTEELRSIPGVGAVHIDLVPGGVSQVAVDATAVSREQLAAAIVEAGYDVAI